MKEPKKGICIYHKQTKIRILEINFVGKSENQYGQRMNRNNVIQVLKHQATSASGFSPFPITILDIKFQKPIPTYCQNPTFTSYKLKLD